MKHYSDIDLTSTCRVTNSLDPLSAQDLVTLNYANTTYVAANDTSTIGGSKTFTNTVDFQSIVDFTVQVPNFYVGLRFYDVLTTFSQFQINQSPVQSLDINWILPPNNGTSGNVLSNDGTGVLAWIAPSSGGANKVTQEVDFGAVGDYLSVTVPATWVDATSSIVLSILPNLTDHDTEDVLLEELKCTYGNIVNGVSFDLHIHAPNETWGRYIVKAVGF